MKRSGILGGVGNYSEPRSGDTVLTQTLQPLRIAFGPLGIYQDELWLSLLIPCSFATRSEGLWNATVAPLLPQDSEHCIQSCGNTGIKKRIGKDDRAYGEHKCQVDVRCGAEGNR